LSGGIFCPGRQQHTLVCSTNHLFLEWSIATKSMHEMRSVSSSGRSPSISPIVLLNTASITFSRESLQMALPLVSILTIENVHSNLEGTVITCTGQNSSSVSSVVLMTTVRFFDSDRGMSTIKLAIVLSLNTVYRCSESSCDSHKE
jgi:hypothetical protein